MELEECYSHTNMKIKIILKWLLKKLLSYQVKQNSMIEELRKDIEQFQGAMEDFYNLVPEDIETAYQLAMVFMQLANR